MAPRLNDFQALTFDCYGTLIDWETGIWDALQPLFAENPGAAVTRSGALEMFGRIEQELEDDNPRMLYSEVLTRVHERLGRDFDLETTPELNRAFGTSIGHWPAFADSAESLRYLKTRFKLFILSNVNRDGFAASNRKLGVAFDGIYTAEDIGSYKPNVRNFEHLITQLRNDHGVERGSILHTAQSLFHDHAPARALGLANAWIDRQRLSEGGSWGATASVAERPKVDFVFFSMGELAEAVRAEANAP